MEIFHSWKSGNTNAWIVPTITAVSIGKQMVQFIIGPRTQLTAPEEAKFGLRAPLVFLFPF